MPNTFIDEAPATPNIALPAHRAGSSELVADRTPATDTADAAPMVATERLGRSFGERVAVRDVHMRVARGEVFGVLGPNGAGKSTLIRMLCGLVEPSEGVAYVAGYEVARHPDEVKQNIGYMTQRFGLYDDLTVRENIEFYACIYRVNRRRRRTMIERQLEELCLGDRVKQLAGTLSGGWKQRLALACATVHAPPLLFLDEPTAGVDPVSRREFWSCIHRLAAGGTTMVVTTHYMDEAERCHRLMFLLNGTVLDTGAPRDLIERRNIQVREVPVADGPGATAVLQDACDGLDVTQHGNILRVVYGSERDDAEAAFARIEAHQLCLGPARGVEPTVEDAFVSLVQGPAQ